MSPEVGLRWLLEWLFLGALGSSGHGRFRAGNRRAVADRPGTLVVPAHLYGYVLSRECPAQIRSQSCCR